MKRYLNISFVFIYLFVWEVENIFGQDSSACVCKSTYSTDLTPSGINMSHIHEKKQVMFSYRYMHVNMQNISDGKTKVTNDAIFINHIMAPEQMNMDMHMFMAMYGITDKTNLMGMFNYNINSMSMSTLSGSHNHNHNGSEVDNVNNEMVTKTSGIGDLKLNLLHDFLGSKSHHLLISLGLNIPVGSINKKGDNGNMYSDKRLPYSMQLGSGTWDLMPGIIYSYENGAISISSQLISTVRTGYNNVGYKLGNEATLNNWFAYRWCKNLSSSFRIESYTSDHIKGKDASLYEGYEPSANPLYYGGEKINGFAGANFYFRKGLLKNNKIGIEYGFPFYQNLNGIQINTKTSLYLSWSVTM